MKKVLSRNYSQKHIIVHLRDRFVIYAVLRNDYMQFMARYETFGILYWLRMSVVYDRHLSLLQGGDIVSQQSRGAWPVAEASVKACRKYEYSHATTYGQMRYGSDMRILADYHNSIVHYTCRVVLLS